MPTEHATSAQLEWEHCQSFAITSDVIWRLDAYRAAFYLLCLARADCRALKASGVAQDLIDQLMTASGSVSANLSEGYSRGTRTDRLRFYGYALSSARECVIWYEAQRDELPDDAVDARLVLLSRVRALLLGMIKSARETGPGGRRFEP